MSSKTPKSNPTASINSRRHFRFWAALALVLCASFPAAWGKDRKPKPSDAVQVIAKMDFDGKTATDMAFHQAGGKSYLYVQLAGDQPVLVVDITNPAKLKTVSSMPSPDKTAANHLSVTKDVAMVSAVASDPASPRPARNQFVLWDISQPRNPRIVQQFSGVTRVIQDERGYIFLLDHDGLWVISEPQKQAPGNDLSIYG